MGIFREEVDNSGYTVGKTGIHCSLHARDPFGPLPMALWLLRLKEVTSASVAIFCQRRAMKQVGAREGRDPLSSRTVSNVRPVQRAN
jgi:hypothetical protein